MEIIWAVLEDIWEGVIAPIFYFNDPGKRIHYAYLATSILLAYYVYKKTKINYPFYRYIFSKRIWLVRSAFIDYKYFFFNGIIKILFFVPIVNAWRYIGVHTNDFLEETFQPTALLLDQNQVIILYSLAVIIAYDFCFYFVHLAMHKIPFLWEFHKIHHSATSLNPITQFRVHPIELMINGITHLLVSSILVGVCDYFYQGSIDLIIYAEANIFSMLFLFWGANLRHSHVKLKYFNRLERFLISPYQHQIHHSDNPIHFNKNMGSKFAVWDTLFGTLVKSKNVLLLNFGLGIEETKNYNSFFKSLITPFKNLFRQFLKLFRIVR